MQQAEGLRPLAGGAVHLPGDPLYDEARMPWNLQVDEHPAAVAYPDRYGTRYGLDAHAVSLLLTCGGLAFGLWWLIDRRTVAARWWWGARWLARIPLASVVLATALYAPGNTV